MEHFDRSTTDPFGSKFTVIPSKQYPGLRRIHMETKHNARKMPKELSGHYTNVDIAKKAIASYLATSWMFADEEAAKAAKPLAKESKKEDAATG